ncbi:MAG: hypothetical protein F4Y21_02515 [Gemmatimonadetes bacterium]|nr:hypothetical protein [Gemmatimonadota bacterium]
MDPWSLFLDPDGDDLVVDAVSADLQVARAWMSSSGVVVRGVKEGTTAVTITAADPEGLTSMQQFDLRVKGSGSGGGSEGGSNNAPVANGTILEQNLEEGDVRVIDASPYYADPDDDKLAFSAESSDNAVVTVTTSGSKVTLSALKEGRATVTTAAADPDGLTATSAFAVTVSAATGENRPPAVIGRIPWQALEAGEQVTLTTSSYLVDPDGDELTLSAESSDPEVIETGVSGNKVELTATIAGTAEVTLTVEDPSGLTATLTFGVTARSAGGGDGGGGGGGGNRPPTVENEFVWLDVERGGTTTLDAAHYFSDPEDDELTYSADSSDPDVIETTVSGSEVKLTARKKGDATVTVYAEDPEGGVTDQAVGITSKDPGTGRFDFNNSPPSRHGFDVRWYILNRPSGGSWSVCKTKDQTKSVPVPIMNLNGCPGDISLAVEITIPGGKYSREHALILFEDKPPPGYDNRPAGTYVWDPDNNHIVQDTLPWGIEEAQNFPPSFGGTIDYASSNPWHYKEAGTARITDKPFFPICLNSRENRNARNVKDHHYAACTREELEDVLFAARMDFYGGYLSPRLWSVHHIYLAIESH